MASSFFRSSFSRIAWINVAARFRIDYHHPIRRKRAIFRMNKKSNNSADANPLFRTIGGSVHPFTRIIIDDFLSIRKGAKKKVPPTTIVIKREESDEPVRHFDVSTYFCRIGTLFPRTQSSIYGFINRSLKDFAS
jgi:hypothetical protein